jgi:hypothetical protein
LILGKTLYRKIKNLYIGLWSNTADERTEITMRLYIGFYSNTIRSCALFHLLFDTDRDRGHETVILLSFIFVISNRK